MAIFVRYIVSLYFINMQLLFIVMIILFKTFNKCIAFNKTNINVVFLLFS